MPKNDALARRWPNGDGGRWQLYLAEVTQEEIAEKVGHAPLRRFPRSAIGPRRMPQRGFPRS
jgi:hypothetical protein